VHIQLQSRNGPAKVVTNTNPHMIHYINSTNRIINLHIKVIAVKHFLVTRLASQIELHKFIQRKGNTAYSLAVRDQGHYLSCRALCLPLWMTRVCSWPPENTTFSDVTLCLTAQNNTKQGKFLRGEKMNHFFQRP
jgi:hypothetical protein